MLVETELSINPPLGVLCSITEYLSFSFIPHRTVTDEVMELYTGEEHYNLYNYNNYFFDYHYNIN